MLQNYSKNSLVANRKSTKKLTTQKTANTLKESNKKLQGKQKLESQILQSHPANRFIKQTKVNLQIFQKFSTLLYRGLFYSVNNLKGPSQQFVKKKSVTLPQPKESFDKYLILDLDETLIHSVFTNEKTDITFTFKGDQFKFNIRPYCLQFLERMSKHYAIYVFTASTFDYAQPIVDFLNEKNKTIHGVLHRKNCMETHNGFFIKDLRIIKNRPLSKMLIVDNLVHSFGLQIDNGIPILQFINNSQDRQLFWLQKFLMEIKEAEDVRVPIRQKINLKKCLEHHQNEFLSFDKIKNQNI